MRYRYVFGTDKQALNQYVMFFNDTVRWYFAPGELHGWREDWYPAAWELSEITP